MGLDVPSRFYIVNIIATASHRSHLVVLRAQRIELHNDDFVSQHVLVCSLLERGNCRMFFFFFFIASIAVAHALYSGKIEFPRLPIRDGCAVVLQLRVLAVMCTTNVQRKLLVVTLLVLLHLVTKFSSRSYRAHAEMCLR